MQHVDNINNCLLVSARLLRHHDGASQLSRPYIKTMLPYAFALAIVCSGVPRLVHAGDAKSADLGTINLGWVKSTANLMAFVAPQLGSKYGLKIENFNFNNSNDIATAMINGQIDFGILTPVHLMRAIDTNVDIVQIAGNARGNTAIVVASRLGLAKNDWNGLKEVIKKRKLRVASSRGSVNEFLPIAEFALHGIDVNKDVELMNVANFAQQPQALRSGDFDIIFTIEPIASMVAAEGVGTIFNNPYDTPAGDLNTTWDASRDWLNKNPQKAHAFVCLLVEAAKWLDSDKKAQLENSEKLTGLDPDVLKAAFANNRYDVHNGLPQMQELARLAYERQFTSRNVADALPKSVDDSFLQECGAEK
jgi:ABC-type nitrate/sulfonate/bicarbonate transport system substrate-binding protein